MRIDYVNLTNGIESLPVITDAHFIRIQSSLCERHKWDKLLQELDYDFLMHLALGDEVFVYDYGARKPVPRAMYQGLEFVRYVLNRRWYGIQGKAVIKKGKRKRGTSVSGTSVVNEVNASEVSECDCTTYFSRIYSTLEKITLHKLDYFKPFLSSANSGVKLTAICDSTEHDGDKKFYNDILQRRECA